MAKIHYSLDEARDILPTIKPLLAKLIKYHIKVDMFHNLSISYDDPYEEFCQTVREQKERHEMFLTFFSTLDKLAKMGIFVKDPAKGLIDLFSFHGGREIFLCYRYPEEGINYWHELDDGFRGRQSVELLERRTKRQRT